MFCKYCGAQLPDGSQFCSSCGKPLGDVDSVTPDTAVPVAVPVSDVVTSDAEPKSGPNQPGSNTGGTGSNSSDAGQAGLKPTSPKPKKSLSKGAKTGIAVGAVVLVVVIVLVLVFTLGGHHKNDVGDGRYADGRKAYRYGPNQQMNPGQLHVTDITITPTSEGLLAEFYLENDTDDTLTWGWADPGRVKLTTYDGNSYISSCGIDANPEIPAGQRGGFQVLFRHAKGVPKKLNFYDISSADPAVKMMYPDHELEASLPAAELS